MLAVTQPLPPTLHISHHDDLLRHVNTATSLTHLKKIHARTIRTTSPHHPSTLFLLSRILLSYSSLNLDYVFRLFAQIETPNSFMYNTLIRACANSKTWKENAVLVFLDMLEKGLVLPDKHTFPFLLKACAYEFLLSEGEQAHGQILKHGFGSDVYVNNSLIHFYGSCGCLSLACKVFGEMPEKSLVSWNVMIDVMVMVGEFENALGLFVEMQRFFEPDQSLVIACAALGALSLGVWVHAYVLKKYGSDFSDDVLMNSALIDIANVGR